MLNYRNLVQLGLFGKVYRKPNSWDQFQSEQKMNDFMTINMSMKRSDEKENSEKSNLATDVLKLFLTPCQVYTTSQSSIIPRARSEHVIMTFTVDVVTAETGVKTPCTLKTGFVLAENCKLYHPYSVERNVVAARVESHG